MMRFCFELANILNHIAEKPDHPADIGDELRPDLHWYVRPSVRTFCRRAGQLCHFIADSLDRWSIWRFQSAAAVMRGLRGARAFGR
ncbi:MAG: hypothetical protein ABL907_25630 [Hyphomicrobium sp.]